MYLALVIVCFCVKELVTATGENSQPGKQNNLRYADLEYLERISDFELNEFLQMSLESVDKRNRYEQILLESQITVQNGTLSHNQLLDTLPNEMALIDSNIATKIVIAGQLFYQSKCAQAGIPAERCEFFLSQKSISVNTNLYEACVQMLENKRNCHHRFRRLLPANYYDGFYEMYPDDQLPTPRSISTKFIFEKSSSNISDDVFDNNLNNLALVQWAQFIEHDVSKPVATSMGNGSPIECCNKNSFKQQPRYQHPACAPILEKNINNKSGKQFCLNYVRSAIAVGSMCNFGAAGQLNQASGVFDLSQLYGYTKEVTDSVRMYKNGLLNHSISPELHQSLLPLVESAKQLFCAFENDDNHDMCFKAGDSRVNTSPFTILIYTLFLRNHNQIANSLILRHPLWNDEKLFQVAQSVNINIYRRIIFEEWLPNVIDFGSILLEVKSGKNSGQFGKTGIEISNEFAVAAIRFYFSMMPSHLQNLSNAKKQVTENNVKPEVSLFDYNDEIFKPKIMYSPSKLNDILDSILQQQARRMDAFFEESFIPHRFYGIRPSHADILAFDIQRGRDHGIRGYVEYLELCTGIKINDWRDLETFIPNENIIKLKNQYRNFNEIDLIVGGLSEHPSNYSVVGPTFKCILGEQFIKFYEWQTHFEKNNNFKEELKYYENITAVDFLCSNSDLRFVPKNIFKIDSTRNPLVSCEDHRSIIRN